jgi:hypothetical protein
MNHAHFYFWPELMNCEDCAIRCFYISGDHDEIIAIVPQCGDVLVLQLIVITRLEPQSRILLNAKDGGQMLVLLEQNALLNRQVLGSYPLYFLIHLIQGF